MANGKIEYSKPELLDLGGVGEVTSGQSLFCRSGSDYWGCTSGYYAGNRGCMTGTYVLGGCGDGTSADAGYPCQIGTGVY